MLKFFTHRIPTYKIRPLRKHIKNPHYFPLVIIAAVGSVFTSFAAVITYQAEFRHLQATFGRQSDYLELSLQRRLDEYYQATVALGAFFDASSQARSSDFQRFTKPLLEQYPGILGMVWLRKVSRTERPAYEAEIQQITGSNSSIIERDQQLNLVRAGDRDFYLPITYGAPENIYQKIYGLDHSVDPYFKEPISQAIDSQNIVSTERIVLVTNSAAGVAF